MPHTDPARAVDLIVDSLRSIPTWPQMPNMGFRENMYAQYARYLPGARIDEERKKIHVDLGNYDPEEVYMKILSEDVDSFSLPEDSFAGFHEFMSRELPATVKAVKGQVTGPVSMGLQITDQNDRPVLYDETYAEIIRKCLNLMARWQERELRKKCDRTIIFWDEPYLSMMGTPFASVSQPEVTAWIADVRSGLEGMTGIHCCANTDWPFVMSLGIDFLSFDAHDYGYTIVLYPEEVQKFLEKGGSLAWGIVPNSEEKLAGESVGSLVASMESMFSTLGSKGVDTELLARQSIITPQCGLSGLDQKRAADVMELLLGVSDALSTKYSLG
jgi:methionine synthase II (cobalamin-independent)